jgi:hypothetical protein
MTLLSEVVLRLTFPRRSRTVVLGPVTEVYRSIWYDGLLSTT